MPHNFSLLPPERFSKVMNTDGSTLHIQTVRGNVRVSDAGQVWRDHGEALR